jgi:hypothetical protein
MYLLRLVGPAILVSAASLSFIAQAETQSQPRAVVELFTSQGCSSCPPADKLLGELSKDNSIVALTLPVDYWDYLGWKDTLASPKHSARQRGYSAARGDREVYTPQVVVNGMTHVLGSDRAAIERAIANSRGKAMTVPVTVADAGDRLIVSVPEKDGARGEVWLCGVARTVPVAIGRGENTGKSVTYYNVGRRWVKVGDWDGKAQTWSVPVSQIRADGIDTAAVLLQGGSAEKPGPMLGAALAGIR